MMFIEVSLYQGVLLRARWEHSFMNLSSYHQRNLHCTYPRKWMFTNLDGKKKFKIFKKTCTCFLKNDIFEKNQKKMYMFLFISFFVLKIFCFIKCSYLVRHFESRNNLAWVVKGESRWLRVIENGRKRRNCQN